MVLSLQTTKQGLVAWSVKNFLRKRASRIWIFRLGFCQRNLEQLQTFVCDVSCSLAWYCTCTYVMSVMSCETCRHFQMFSVMYLYNLVHHHLCFLPYFWFKGVEGGNPILSSLKFVKSGVCRSWMQHSRVETFSVFESNGEKIGHGFFES